MSTRLYGERNDYSATTLDGALRVIRAHIRYARSQSDDVASLSPPAPPLLVYVLIVGCPYSYELMRTAPPTVLLDVLRVVNISTLVLWITRDRTPTELDDTKRAFNTETAPALRLFTWESESIDDFSRSGEIRAIPFTGREYERAPRAICTWAHTHAAGALDARAAWSRNHAEPNVALIGIVDDGGEDKVSVSASVAVATHIGNACIRVWDMSMSSSARLRNEASYTLNDGTLVVWRRGDGAWKRRHAQSRVIDDVVEWIYRRTYT